MPHPPTGAGRPGGPRRFPPSVAAHAGADHGALREPLLASSPPAPAGFPPALRVTSDVLVAATAKCKAGHALAPFVTQSDGYVCNLCGTVIRAQSTLLGCRLCGWDVCGDCGGKQASSATPLPPPLSRSIVDDHSKHDIIQFEAPMFFVEESERCIHIGIMRLGSLRGEVLAHFHTTDASAVSGVRYEAAQGTVKFGDGDFLKSIEVRIIEDSRWATTTEFKCHLSNPINCELGEYLHHCRVKVMDNDYFPSSKYADKIREGHEGIDSIPTMGLLWEYFKLNLRSPGMAWRTVTMMLVCQIENFYVLFTLYMNIYFVDVLFSKEEESEAKLYMPTRRGTAIAIGAMYIVPMFVLHLVDLKVVKLDVNGMSREYLQSNLFRKYLNFGEKVREGLSSSSMQVAILQGTGEVVEGYMAALELIKAIFKLAILIVFILSENQDAWLPVVLMPSAMALFVMLRTEVMIKAVEKAAETTADVYEVVQEACQKYTLLAEYARRPHMCDRFHHAAEKRNNALVPAECVKLNNSYFPKWLGPVFIGVYVAYSAGPVLDGNVSLGAFLATVRIFKELSEQFSEMYVELLKIAGAAGPLRKLTGLFNLPTDTPTWKRINRFRREKTKEALMAICASAAIPDPMGLVRMQSDEVKIVCKDVAFGYTAGISIIRGVDVEVPQGKMVAVVGEHGSGKRTFMRLLGHMIFPLEGYILVPAYLQILYVSQTPMMLNESPWENLTFGDATASPQRVRNILKAMEMTLTLKLVDKELKTKHGDKTKHKCEKVESDCSGDSDTSVSEGVADWQETLNYIEIAKIHLARAFIVNPDVLVLQRPFVHFGERVRNHLFSNLLAHVQHKGLLMGGSPAEEQCRRPRTCFFSPCTLEEAYKSDVIWKIAASTVTEIKVEQLNEDDVGLASPQPPASREQMAPLSPSNMALFASLPGHSRLGGGVLVP